LASWHIAFLLFFARSGGCIGAGHPAPVPEQENRSPGFFPSLSDEKKAPDLSPKPFDF